MKPPTSDPVRDARARVLFFLAFLTSEGCREACRPLLPPERLAYELCRLWLDEIYVPGIRYMDGLKGNRSEETAAQFRACFSPEEREALERFHRFLELRIDMLPKDARSERRFPQNDSWENLVRDAAYLLESLAAEPDALREAQASAARSLTAQNGPPALLRHALHDRHTGDA